MHLKSKPFDVYTQSNFIIHKVDEMSIQIRVSAKDCQVEVEKIEVSAGRLELCVV